MIKKEHFVLLFIFLLAILIRANIDPDIPYHYDPGKNIVYARAALLWLPLVPQYNPYFNLGEYYEYQVLFPYTVAFIHRLTGISLVEITKWLVIISGAALSLTVYYLSLEMFNNRTAALISAFLVAVSKIQLITYMNYYPQIMAMTIMPLSFVFLIRFLRCGKKRHLLLVAILSSLIVLASYIAAFVYFVILLLSLGIYCTLSGKSFRYILIRPLMTGAFLTFFWLPMIWRYGLLNFSLAALGRILNTQGAFTNQPWNLADFMNFSNTALIAVILGIFAVLYRRKFTLDFQKLLLAVWLVITFVLMESYIFKPVLWVDRYFQFFDIALIISAGGFLAFFVDKVDSISKITFKHKGYLLLLLLIYPLYAIIYPIYETGHADFTFGKWGYPSDMQMLDYMQGLPQGSLVVAPPSLHSFWVPALSGVNVLGGESSQMIEHRYIGDGDSNLIINSPDIDLKMGLIRKYGVNYIFIPIHEPLFMVWNPLLEEKGLQTFNNSTYFEVNRVFKDAYGMTVLVKVKEDLVPKYNAVKIDWNVTVAGYVISVLSLLVFVYVPKKRWLSICNA